MEPDLNEIYFFDSLRVNFVLTLCFVYNHNLYICIFTVIVAVSLYYWILLFNVVVMRMYPFRF